MVVWLDCTFVFATAYLVNLSFMTVFYHRGLAHGSLRLKPGVQRAVARWGHWVTGVEPKIWCCMHRLHHRYADGPRDPHSPHERGIWAVFAAQIRAYEKTRHALVTGRTHYTAVVSDLTFPVSWLGRRGWWAAPYALHAAIAVGLAWLTAVPGLGVAYFIGLLSHPIGGWLVNALGHRYGYRNFPTRDHSRNNRWVAWAIGGEGYQNNHHWRPDQACFAAARGEFDFGYLLCRLAAAAGWIELPPQS
jgi:stearoyl-CoA desaturase (delta-9 desaturase)